ncbi:hypothetical protein Leryth_025042 [Lithospermum erythrorhizon]|nr:hypothetical protein Leryth_025042 [Lithospermum erythrorhizon]
MNEEKQDHMEIDIAATSPSSESFIDDEDEEDDDDVQLSKREEPLTEEEIDELVAELVEVERKAAEAQEALEEDSITGIEEEVKEELAQTLSGEEVAI